MQQEETQGQEPERGYVGQGEQPPARLGDGEGVQDDMDVAIGAEPIDPEEDTKSQESSNLSAGSLGVAATDSIWNSPRALALQLAVQTFGQNGTADDSATVRRAVRIMRFLEGNDEQVPG